jgi:hypothetical protein
MKAPGTCSSLCSAEYLLSTTTAARSSAARRWTWKGAVGQAGGEVLQALALDRGEQRTLVGPDRVVTGGERDPLGRDVPPREAVRGALPGIDEDEEPGPVRALWFLSPVGFEEFWRESGESVEKTTAGQSQSLRVSPHAIEFLCANAVFVRRGPPRVEG